MVERAVTIARHEGLAKKAESVIYPNSPRLTGLNSHPINADSYLIGWRGLLAVWKGDFVYVRCCLSSIEDFLRQYRGLLDAVLGAG